ncbi:hypothetical protein J6TS1_51900 [Siminovitchia terrae]|uniref:Uncharacterized protein n=1 Tax=Siminovitchia terrae TaxID=1914933 RepID=A0ABQ4L520_SIMTE|nr:hypothetical protein J6TS1_51900 [Siminovitchia terrae]
MALGEEDRMRDGHLDVRSGDVGKGMDYVPMRPPIVIGSSLDTNAVVRNAMVF